MFLPLIVPIFREVFYSVYNTINLYLYMPLFVLCLIKNQQSMVTNHLQWLPGSFSGVKATRT